MPAVPNVHGPGRTSAALRACLLRKALADCRQRAAAARMLGLTVTDVLALQHLAWAGVLTPSALSARLHLTSGGTSTLVQRLDRHGLVTGEPHPEDRRSTLLRLSSTGEQRATRAYAPLVRDVDAVIDALEADDRAVVEAFLDRVAEVTDACADELARSLQRKLPIEAAPHAGLWA